MFSRFLYCSSCAVFGPYPWSNFWPSRSSAYLHGPLFVARFELLLSWVCIVPARDSFNGEQCHPFAIWVLDGWRNLIVSILTDTYIHKLCVGDGIREAYGSRRKSKDWLSDIWYNSSLDLFDVLCYDVSRQTKKWTVDPYRRIGERRGRRRVGEGWCDWLALCFWLHV